MKKPPKYHNGWLVGCMYTYVLIDVDKDNRNREERERERNLFIRACH